MPPPFTEPGRRAELPYAVGLERLSAEIRADLAEQLGVSSGDGDAGALRDALSDPTRTHQRLSTLPAHALLVLEAVAEAGGRLESTDLDAVCKERIEGMHSLGQVVALLRALGLVHVIGTGRSSAVALVQPEAESIARLLVGVSHPEEMPPEPPTDTELLGRERDVLAVATLSVHRKLRWTREGAPHRVTFKSFAKGLGPTEARVEDLLVEAVRAGLLPEVGEGRRLHVGRLSEAATLGLRPLPASLLGTVDAAVPADGWIAAVALGPHLTGFGVMGRRAVLSEKAVVDVCRGRFVIRKHAGHAFVGRPARPAKRTGDGHVTPNLEVLLGPEAHPEVVVDVGSFAELVRLDRVLTFRITQASVAQGLGTGQTLQGFLDALDSVGRHPVPDNVRITVRDFAGRVATMKHVLSVEVPEAATETLVRELGSHVVAVPRPGLLLVDPRTDPAVVAKPLARLGLFPASVESDVEDPMETPWQSRTNRIRPPLLPDPALRAAVLRARQNAFVESAAELGRLVSTLPSTVELNAVETARGARQDLARSGAPKAVLRELDRLAALLDGVPLELEAWMNKLKPAEAQTAREEARSPFALIPYASLPPIERSKVLMQARSWPALVQHCQSAVAGGLATPEGASVILALSALASEGAPESRGARTDDLEFEPRHVRAGPEFEATLRSFLDDDPEAFGCVVLKPAPGSRLSYVHHVVSLKLQKRGTETVLLATDLDTEERVAFPLAKIESVNLDDEFDPEDYEDDDLDEDDDAAPELDS